MKLLSFVLITFLALTSCKLTTSDDSMMKDSITSSVCPFNVSVANSNLNYTVGCNQEGDIENPLQICIKNEYAKYKYQKAQMPSHMTSTEFWTPSFAVGIPILKSVVKFEDNEDINAFENQLAQEMADAAERYRAATHKCLGSGNVPNRQKYFANTQYVNFIKITAYGIESDSSRSYIDLSSQLNETNKSYLSTTMRISLAPVYGLSSQKYREVILNEFLPKAILTTSVFEIFNGVPNGWILSGIETLLDTKADKDARRSLLCDIKDSFGNDMEGFSKHMQTVLSGFDYSDRENNKSIQNGYTINFSYSEPHNSAIRRYAVTSAIIEFLLHNEKAMNASYSPNRPAQLLAQAIRSSLVNDGVKDTSQMAKIYKMNNLNDIANAWVGSWTPHLCMK